MRTNRLDQALKEANHHSRKAAEAAAKAARHAKLAQTGLWIAIIGGVLMGIAAVLRLISVLG